MLTVANWPPPPYIWLMDAALETHRLWLSARLSAVVPLQRLCFCCCCEVHNELRCVWLPATRYSMLPGNWILICAVIHTKKKMTTDFFSTAGEEHIAILSLEAAPQHSAQMCTDKVTQVELKFLLSVWKIYALTNGWFLSAWCLMTIVHSSVIGLEVSLNLINSALNSQHHHHWDA